MARSGVREVIDRIGGFGLLEPSYGNGLFNYGLSAQTLYAEPHAGLEPTVTSRPTSRFSSVLPALNRPVYNHTDGSHEKVGLKTTVPDQRSFTTNGPASRNPL